MAALERHRRKDEARRDGGEHEPREPEVQERHQRDVEEAHGFAAVQRQGLDVEQVHQHKHAQQDELAPLRGVAEEQLDVLDHELALRDRQKAQRRADGSPPDGPPHEPLGGLLGLREPRCEQLPVEQRAQRHERRRGGPEEGDGQQVRLTRSEEHTSELQSLAYLVCRLLLEKKKKKKYIADVEYSNITNTTSVRID